MLINLEATNNNGDLTIELPFSRFQNHTVAITELFIRWKEPTAVNGYISSTLIDRSAFNPKQIMIVFCHEESSYFHTKPTQLQSYKIQRVDLQTAEFKIHLSEKSKLKKIKEIFIQLKIIDAGIQQRPELKIQ